MSAIHAIVFLPLIASAIAGFGHKWIGVKAAQLVTCLSMVVAAGLSVAMFWFQMDWKGIEPAIHLLTWISSGDFEVSWALRVDQLTAVMLVVVTVVSAVVHIYAVGYMHEDPEPARFTSYLSLFTF